MRNSACLLAILLLAIDHSGPGETATLGPSESSRGTPPGVSRDTPAPQVVEAVEAAKVMIKAGQFEEGERRLRALLHEVETTLGSDSIEALLVLNALIDALLRGSKSTSAECLEFADRAVRIAEDGRHQGQLLKSLVRRGAVLRERGKLTEARACLDRAVSVQDALGTPDTLGVTEALADISIEQGFYADARVTLERKLAALTSSGDGGARDLMALRYGLARLLVRMGEYSDAENLYRQAIAATGDALRLAYLLNGLGILKDEIGDYPEAQDLYERAKTSAEKVDADHPIVGSILNNLGYLHKNMGDYSGAKEYYERALQLHLRTRGGESTLSASSLVNLADIYRLEGSFDQAENSYGRALHTRERILGPDHPMVATSLKSLADLHLETGRAGKAAALLVRALGICERTFGRAHVDTWETLAGLAKARDETGDREAAGRLYEEALAALEAALGRDNPRCAEALRPLAWFYERTGRRQDALALAVRAETLSREHARLLASSLPERQALRYASVRPDGLHLILSVAADDRSDRVVKSAWDVVVRSRALVLDEIAARHRALRFDDPETARVASAYAAASQRLAHLMLASQDPEKLESLRAQVDEARRDRERWERRLAEESPAFRAAKSLRGVGLDQVRAALPSGAALVGFVRYERWVRESGARGIDSGDAARAGDIQRDYLAFVLPASGGAACVVPLGPAAPIDRMVEAWSREIEKAPFAQSRDAARASYRVAGSQLRTAVWDPLTRVLGDPHIVFLVPDGALHRISFAALPVGENRYLIESGMRFHYVSAERDLAAGTPTGAAASGLLVLGGAAFGAGAEGSAAEPLLPILPMAGARFQPLPATAEEARTVAELWKGTAKAGLGKRSSRRFPRTGTDNRDVVLLTGTDATEAAFKKLAPGRRILHVATHGFFLDEGGRQATGSGTTRGIGGVGRLGEGDRPHIPHPHPLRLSGLALAGANRLEAVGPDDEDGVLTSEEISAMNLSGAEWAVLSACDTGVGAVQDVEGIVGLRRAFQVAGVRTLIMSLWAVEDRTTLQWMEELYRSRFEDGSSTLDAVHQASLSVLRSDGSGGDGEHPFYWAAFVAAGNWR